MSDKITDIPQNKVLSEKRAGKIVDPDIKIFDKGKDIISLTNFDAGVRHGKIKVEIYEEDKK